MATCRNCGMVGSHWTRHCPANSADAPQLAEATSTFAPLVTEVDPAWKATVRDLCNADYIAWLAGPHRLVRDELKNLRRTCERIKHDIELDGAVKELMIAGWRHGPYVHDTDTPQAKWKKWRLKVSTEASGRVCFVRKSMAVEFEDTTGELRTLNANNFFTKLTPEDNQLKHVTNAILGSVEWKERSPKCTTEAKLLARHVLHNFPEVEYRREGDSKVFVKRHRRDNDVYMFIKDELRGGALRSAASSGPHSDGLAEEEQARIERILRQQELSKQVSPSVVPESWESLAVSEPSDTEPPEPRCIVAVLRLHRNPEIFRNTLLNSQFAVEARDKGLVIEPEWAKGAKIFVRVSVEALLEYVDLRPYHVVVSEIDVPRVEEILRTLPCRQRPLIKSEEMLPLEQISEPDEPQAMSFVVENTFINFLEPAKIPPPLGFTRSCNDADVQHSNPRMTSFQDQFAAMKICHHKCDLPEAVKCYSKMMAEGGKPSLGALTILIDICGKTGDCDAAEAWMHIMQKKGIAPSRVTFNCLIKGSALTGNVVKAKKWFHAMQDADIKPDLLSYNCMVQAFVMQGSVAQAEEWVEEAKRNGHELGTTTYRLLLQLYARTGLPDKAEGCLAQMEFHGLQSSERTLFKFVASAHATAKDFENTKKWIDKAGESGFEPAVHEYTQLLRACGPKQGQSANDTQARSTFLQQVAAGIPPNRDNLDALDEALGCSAARSLCAELHIHTRAARLAWWPDPRNFEKPTRLARHILRLPDGSVADRAERC